LTGGEKANDLYIYFYCPKDSEIPEIVGSLISDEGSEIAMQKAEDAMPKEMKDQGYRFGGSRMEEGYSIDSQWDIEISSLKIRSFTGDSKE
jgi:hypothetical protein